MEKILQASKTRFDLTREVMAEQDHSVVHAEEIADQIQRIFESLEQQPRKKIIGELVRELEYKRRQMLRYSNILERDNFVALSEQSLAVLGFM